MLDTSVAPVTKEGRTEPRPPSSLAARVSRRLWQLDFEKLCDAARRRTGLMDFGNPPLRPALPILVNSLEQEAGLRPIGRLLMRIHLMDLLATRLQLQQAWRGKLGSIERERIIKPVFIVGMPRSGSTFLHELLGAGTAHRAPRVWEVMYPLAASAEASGSRERYIRKATACLWWFRRLAPEADAVYPMRALTPHECVAIHSYTFRSEEFVSTCEIPGYQAFLRRADFTPVYQWEKRFLQYLQLGNPDKRWVLKSPDHVYGLEALFAVFPDAFLVQTHRNPIEVIKSSVALTRVLNGLYGRSPDVNKTLARETRLLAENTERFIQFRDRHSELADRIIDVRYSDLIADPLPVVRNIYARLGTPFDEATAERVRRLVSQRSRYPGPRASAKNSRGPVAADAEIRIFERYCLRFGLPFLGRE